MGIEFDEYLFRKWVNEQEGAADRKHWDAEEISRDELEASIEARCECLSAWELVSYLGEYLTIIRNPELLEND